MPDSEEETFDELHFCTPSLTVTCRHCKEEFPHDMPEVIDEMIERRECPTCFPQWQQRRDGWDRKMDKQRDMEDFYRGV